MNGYSPGVAEGVIEIGTQVGLRVELPDLDPGVGEVPWIVGADDRRDRSVIDLVHRPREVSGRCGAGGSTAPRHRASRGRPLRTSLCREMHVRVRLFAVLRERAGATELELELPSGASVASALEQVSWLTEDVPVVMAVNREYAQPSTILRARRRAGADPASVRRRRAPTSA